MTLEELKKEKARIEKEIEILSGLNFDRGVARLQHRKECGLHGFRIKLRFSDDRGKISYKEVFRYNQHPADDTDEEDVIEETAEDEEE